MSMLDDALEQVGKLFKENAELRVENDRLRAQLANHSPGPKLHGLRRPNGHVTPGDADWCLRQAATGEGEFVEAETCVYRGQWHDVEQEADRG